MTFYICDHCKNIITKVNDAKVPVICCGQKMTELIPGTSDGAVEKHVPVFTVEGSTVAVKVGSAAHPMTEAHYIQWICVETKQGFEMKYLTPASAPEATFALAAGDEVVAVYAYCNLHGLWKA